MALKVIHHAIDRLVFAAFSVVMMVVCLSTVRGDSPSYETGYKAFAAGEHIRANEIWLPLAKAGDRDAQFAIGNAYSNGHGVEKNLSQAIEWYLKAANNGLASAQYNLALEYHHTPEIRDYKQAAVWYEKAARQEHLGALVNLGVLHMSGFGVAKDDATAVALYRIAAVNGHALAQVYLGDMYHWGRGLERDDGKALVWYREAAEQGDLRGLLKLAIAHRDGIGVFADPVLAYVFASHDPKFRKTDLVERSTLAAALKERLSEAQREEAAELMSAWGGTRQLPITSRTGRP